MRGAFERDAPANKAVLILAVPEMGKTHLLKGLVLKHRLVHPTLERPIIVGDSLSSWGSIPGVEYHSMIDPEELARYAIRRAPSILVIDEIDLALPSERMPPPDSALMHIARYGRHAKPENPFRRRGPVCLWGTARRATDVHVRFRALCDTFFFGHLEDESDLAWIKSRGWKDVAERCPSLTVGQFIRRGSA